jgi:hypothetical protein
MSALVLLSNSSSAEEVAKSSSSTLVLVWSVVSCLHLVVAQELWVCMGRWRYDWVGLPNLLSFSAAIAAASHVPAVTRVELR